jgi:cell division protein FtsB
MKTIFTIISIAIFNSIAFGQNMGIEKLTAKIDSLQKIEISNNNRIEELNAHNRQIKQEVEKYNSEINRTSNKGQVGTAYVCIMGTKIYAQQQCYESLASIGKGEKVYVVGSTGNCYKVSFGEAFGYVSKAGFISESENLKNIETSKQKEQENILVQQKLLELQKQNELATEKQKEVRKNDLVKKYGQTSGLKIYESRIWVGMTKEMVIDSWGKPLSINRTGNEWGVHEQWVYGDHRYLYIENGKLTSWQD